MDCRSSYGRTWTEKMEAWGHPWHRWENRYFSFSMLQRAECAIRSNYTGNAASSSSAGDYRIGIRRHAHGAVWLRRRVKATCGLHLGKFERDLVVLKEFRPLEVSRRFCRLASLQSLKVKARRRAPRRRAFVYVIYFCRICHLSLLVAAGSASRIEPRHIAGARRYPGRPGSAVHENGAAGREGDPGDTRVR